MKQAAAAACRRLVMRLRLLLLHHHHAPSGGAPLLRRLILLFLLLCFCCCCCLLLVALAAASHRHRHPDASAASPPGKGYTILINTWRRNELLKKSIRHYSTCSGVDSIHIVWSEPGAPADSLYDILTQAVKSNSNNSNSSSNSGLEIQFSINKENSLNNRFKPIEGLNTEAIFSVDDDVIVPCSSLEFAFSVWRTAPSTMVGFVPRLHWLHKPRSNAKQYQYRGWWSVWWTGTYSMVLSKASFFHKKYLDLYTNHMPPSVRDYVTKNRNCEDIAMSFLVANVTGAPPVWVKGKIIETGSRGLSSMKGHKLQRSECLNTFAAMYGHMPLVATTVKAIDSRKSWLW